jgi:hypothetical protein
MDGENEGTGFTDTKMTPHLQAVFAQGLADDSAVASL